MGLQKRLRQRLGLSRVGNQMFRYYGAMPKSARRYMLPIAVYGRQVRKKDAAAWRRLGLPDRLSQGPFAGMRIVPASAGSVFPAKLVGTYEKELWPVWEHVRENPPSAVIDVGCAEGYYAIGLARMLPPTIPVYAFDVDKRAQILARTLTKLNDVEDRVHVGGLCDHARMQQLLTAHPDALLIVDCEGAESELIDPELVPALAQSRVVVELHDGRQAAGQPRPSEAIPRRLGPTHELRQFEPQPRTAADVSPELGLTPEEADSYAQENRKIWTPWVYAIPKT